VNDRSSKIDMAHSLASYAGVGYLDTAPVTDNAFEFCTLVLAATTFIVAFRTKDAFTEQPVLFRSIGSVVDCLGFLNLAKTPTANIAWTCKPNTCRFEIVDSIKDLFRHASLFPSTYLLKIVATNNEIR